MPALDSPQFRDYGFQTTKNEFGSTAVVAKMHGEGNGWPEALGAIEIESPDFRLANAHQQDINLGRDTHGSRFEPSGQGRWTRGNMDPQYSRVSWAGIADVPGHTRLLHGLGALAVHEHGSMPVADYTLSYDGARLSRGAARKYGMKPHPDNPEMQGGFSYRGDRDHATRSHAEREWRSEPGEWLGDTTKEYTAREVAGITRQVEERYRVGKQKTPEQTPIHPAQLRLL